MTYKCKFLAFSLCAILGLPWISGGANAACVALPGTWFFYAIQGEAPEIQTYSQTVMTSPTSSTSVIVFSKPKTFMNDTTQAIRCKMPVLADGSFTATCTDSTSMASRLPAAPSPGRWR